MEVQNTSPSSASSPYSSNSPPDCAKCVSSTVPIFCVGSLLLKSTISEATSSGFSLATMNVSTSIGSPAISGSALKLLDDESGTCLFAELPYPLVATIVARLSHLEDAVSVLSTSHFFQSAVAGASMRICVAADPVEVVYNERCQFLEWLDSFKVSNTNCDATTTDDSLLSVAAIPDIEESEACTVATSKAQKAQKAQLAVLEKPRNRANSSERLLDSSWVNDMVAGITKHMPHLQELDMSGCAVTDEGVALIVKTLHNLDCLILDNCLKLSSSLVEDFSKFKLPAPRTLSLERCFGLSATSLSSLLGNTRLECLLLSHMERLEVCAMNFKFELESRPQLASEKHFSGMNEFLRNQFRTGGGLRILALHCCAKVDKYQLEAVALSFPQLEILLLGGSAFGLEGQGSGASDALVEVGRSLKKLRLLELTFFGRQTLEAVRSELPGVMVWDFSNKQCVLDAADVISTLQDGYIHSSAYFLGPERPLSENSRPISGDVTRAENTAQVEDKDLENSGLEEMDGSMDLPVTAGQTEVLSDKERLTFFEIERLTRNWNQSQQRDFVFAIKAAASCFDSQRKTPLHIAAAKNDPALASCLLVLGASAVGVKDGRGASALFIAAENGSEDVVKVLLRGGADPLAKTRQGENPLYIAALKGHAPAVEAMLMYCLIRGLPWLDTASYGDGWTPLMAAAVANRQDVAGVLLSLLNQPLRRVFSSHDLQAKSLLDAQNRYGQTALHISAKKSRKWFVDSLLEAGASPAIRDAYGLKASHVAAKEAHREVLAVLKAAEGEKSEKTGKSRKEAGKSKKDNGKKRSEHGGNREENGGDSTRIGGNSKDTMETRAGMEKKHAGEGGSSVEGGKHKERGEKRAEEGGISAENGERNGEWGPEEAENGENSADDENSVAESYLEYFGKAFLED